MRRGVRGRWRGRNAPAAGNVKPNDIQRPFIRRPLNRQPHNVTVHRGKAAKCATSHACNCPACCSPARRRYKRRRTSCPKCPSTASSAHEKTRGPERSPATWWRRRGAGHQQPTGSRWGQTAAVVSRHGTESGGKYVCRMARRHSPQQVARQNSSSTRKEGVGFKEGCQGGAPEEETVTMSLLYGFCVGRSGR